MPTRQRCINDERSAVRSTKRTPGREDSRARSARRPRSGACTSTTLASFIHKGLSAPPSEVASTASTVSSGEGVEAGPSSSSSASRVSTASRARTKAPCCFSWRRGEGTQEETAS